MLYYKKYQITIFILVIITSNVCAEEQYNEPGDGRVLFSRQNLSLDVEVALTRQQRAVGLMFRENLAVNKGMLFIFDQEKIQRVWMKNVVIALDVIFLSEKGKIVSIIKNLQPCIIAYCVIFESTVKAKYMLEINSGIVDKKGIKIGQSVLFYLENY